jgi:hypothetical protein
VGLRALNVGREYQKRPCPLRVDSEPSKSKQKDMIIETKKLKTKPFCEKRINESRKHSSLRGLSRVQHTYFQEAC